MFTFGFSYIGIIYLLMLFTPNMIWAKNQPKGYNAEDENKILLILERIGEALCTCCVLIFSDFNIHATKWMIWLGLSFFMMILYELYWIRYFKSEKTLEDFYKPFLGVPVPGATLAVMAFFFLGIYGTNIFLIVSSIILGIGHIGIHEGHYKKLNPKKDKLSIRLLKGFVCTVLSLFFVVLSFFIGAKNFHYMNHYQLIQKGVDEGVYVELGGEEQYVLIRGSNIENPVIVFLHGGPSSPESYVNYSWVDDLVKDYTVVDWDQRGCGRTYMHNCDIDPDNDTATYEQALTDLDELVDYVSNRFQQKQVILIGHSYGTVLGTDYIERHPGKVSSYVGIAQVISMDINNHVLANEAILKAESKDTKALKEALEDYEANPNVLTTISLRQEASKFLEESLQDNSTWFALTSPYMGMPDFEWFLKQLSSTEEYIELNKQLYDSLLEFNLYDVKFPENIPVTFISGTLDQACPIATIQDYIEQSGVNGILYTIEDCGHKVQYTKPHEVSTIILKVLKGKNDYPSNRMGRNGNIPVIISNKIK